jgi:hypothetical protein
MKLRLVGMYWKVDSKRGVHGWRSGWAREKAKIAGLTQRLFVCITLASHYLVSRGLR